MFTTCLVAGIAFAAANQTADGSDLRPAGGDVGSLVADRTRQAEQRRTEARRLQQQVDSLSRSAGGAGLSGLLKEISTLGQRAGLTTERGPGLRIELDDAPRTVDVPPGADENVLVVHQQDIQAFVNAMWAGGATAVTLQGQRLITTTGIKCVGSTVILDGVPYSPPYVIEAIGDTSQLQAALDASSQVLTYRRYVQAVQLGLSVEPKVDLRAKPYAGTISLRHARPLD
ncbi:MAG: DUF881 domain-containing protein [Aeromicrobium erythreum]